MYSEEEAVLQENYTHTTHKEDQRETKHIWKVIGHCGREEESQNPMYEWKTTPLF